MERVILVDEEDRQIGTEEKIKAHKEARLHRAFSIFVFNRKGELLLQRRARAKYHSGGLWSNTCCSHQLDGETLQQSIHKKLVQEMGFDCEMGEAFSFIYKASLDRGLSEHEFDHVFIGMFDGEPNPNPEEVSGWRWAGLDELKRDVKAHPEKYTVWFRIALDRVASHVNG